MTQQLHYSNTSYGKTIHPDQLTQIIEAILNGKYSWACFLLLRCAGYDPLHYLPYRTYHRLVKENCQADQRKDDATQTSNPDRPFFETKSNSTYSGKSLSQITDLPYLEEVSEQHPQVRGGCANEGLPSNPPKLPWMLSKIQGFLSLNH